MSSQGVQLTHDSRLADNYELTQADFSKKFGHPNSVRLQKEKSNDASSDADLKVKFSSDNPSFVHEGGVEEQENDKVSSSVLPIKDESSTSKKYKSDQSKTRCLLIVIVILVVLLTTMTALFVWRMVCCSNSNTASTSYSTVPPTSKPAQPPSSSGCISLPSPVDFQAFPASIQKALDNFKTYLSQAVSNNQTVSASVNVVYLDKVVMEASLGVMDRDEKPTRPPTPQTPYPCASVSKILTAVMLYKLLGEGKVRSLVDDTLVEYEPKFEVNNPFNDHNITLLQLATHTSGLPREAPCYPDTSTNLCPYDYDTMLNRIKNLTLVQKPGYVPQYSNLGFALLGQVLYKKFSSEPTFAKWIEKELLTKLNMTNTTFSVDRNQTDHIPVGYLFNMKPYPILDWGWSQASGGMFASVNDLAKLQIELMSDHSADSLLPYQLKQQFFKPNFVFPGGDGGEMISSPLRIASTAEGYHLREYTGFIYGYNSYMVMVPEIKLGLNLLCTGCNNKLSEAGRSQFLKLLSVFHEELKRISAKNLTMPPDPQVLIGRYNSSIPVILYMDVKEKKGDTNFLVLAVNGFEAFYLKYKSPLTFSIKMNPLLPCFNKYMFGVENDLVVFTKPKTPGGSSPGFAMYGAHPSGYSYFHRQ